MMNLKDILTKNAFHPKKCNSSKSEVPYVEFLYYFKNLKVIIIPNHTLT